MVSQAEQLDHDDVAVSTFNIDLSPTGDEGSTYRFKNHPDDPYQRRHWTERKGVIDVRCSALDVVHGLWSPEAPLRFCTLVVLQFRFDARRASRRIARANIELRFFGKTPGDDEVEVAGIWPHGKLALQRTTQNEENTVGAGVNVGSGMVVDVGAELKWEKTVTRDTTDATTVVGSADTRGRSWGEHNSASWTLLENSTMGTGVPAAMRAAILLRRKTEDKFQCTFEIEAKADWKSSLQGMFGKREVDDAVLFDPLRDSTNNLREYEETELGKVDLATLGDITTSTVYMGDVKKM